MDLVRRAVGMRRGRGVVRCPSGRDLAPQRSQFGFSPQFPSRPQGAQVHSGAQRGHSHPDGKGAPGRKASSSSREGSDEGPEARAGGAGGTAPRAEGPPPTGAAVVVRCNSPPGVDGCRPWRACGHPERALPQYGHPERAWPESQASSAAEVHEAHCGRDGARGSQGQRGHEPTLRIASEKLGLGGAKPVRGRFVGDR